MIAPSDAARFLRRHEVVTLVGKIERRLELRDHVEEIALDLADRLRQRALELIECRARLQWRHRVDQIGDGFRLDQIDLVVKKGAERELARFGEPRAGIDRARARWRSSTTGLPCADSSTTSSPVYDAGAGKVGDDDLIGGDLGPTVAAKVARLGLNGLTRPVSSRAMRLGIRTADSHHANTATSGWGSDRDDRVGRGEHDLVIW